MGKMKWTDEQYTAIYARGKRILVSAAAGSGKTAVLVERVFSRISNEADPASLDELVLLTFTNAAASEMRSRISDRINAELARDPGNARLRRELDRVQTARIMTVHAFCARLVRENFHALGISPEFRIISGEEEETMRRAALAEYMEGEYAAADEAAPLWELAENASGARDDLGLQELVLSIAGVLRNSADPEGQAARFLDMTGLSAEADASETVWGRIYIDAVQKKLRLGEFLHGEIARRAEELGLEGKNAELLASEREAVKGFAGAASWDVLRSALLGYKFETLRFTKKDPEGARKAIKPLRDMAKDLVTGISKGVLQYTNEEILNQIRVNAPLVRELVRLAEGFSAAWQAKKNSLGLLGFDDLEHCALGVLSEKTDGEMRPSVLAREYGAKIREIMVDEYQDTNGLQDEIFKCLTAGGAELFAVGDVKQSIYGFRNAEPEIFLRRRRDGVRVEPFSPGCGETRLSHSDSTIVMQKNFRSTPAVTDAVNGVFRLLMTGTFGGMDYLRADELVACREGENPEDIAEFDIVSPAAVSEEALEDADGGQSVGAREQEARWIARRVEKMLAGGRTVFDRELGGHRPIRPGDIAVLVRSARRRVSVLAEAFSARGIPVNTDGGGDIFGAAEVNAVMSMLSAVDNPSRELALIGYLRSPLVGFSPDDLGRVKIAGGGGNFYAALKLCAEGTGATPGKCRRALDGLKKMRLAAADLDVGKAVSLLLDMSGAFVVFGAMDGGLARRANLNLLAGLASAYAARGDGDLGGFVKSLERSRDHGDEFPAPKLAGEGVRIMTVHASKGLEFPVVFLANTMEHVNTGWKRENVHVHRSCGLGMMYTDMESFSRQKTLPREAAAEMLYAEQLAEELRLLYVAMTRARDKLVVTGYCEKPEELMASVASDGSAEWLGGICSEKASFGRWILAAMSAGVKLPVKLNIVTDVEAGESCSEAAAENVEAVDEALVELVSRRANFAYPHGLAASLPAKMTATGYNGLVELAGETLRDYKDIALPDFMDRTGDMSAAERGVAVHLAMQLLPMRKYSDTGDAEAELGALVSRGVLSGRQRSAISPEGVRAFYDSEIGARVLSGENRSVRREFKFSLLCPAEKFAGPDGAGEEVLLQGVVDLFWVNADGSVELADYKTDNVRPGEEAARAEGYRAQLEVYSYALEEMLGAPVKKAYIWFFKTGKAVCLEL